MSEWLVEWCLFLASAAVRALVFVFAVEEEHRPKHALTHAVQRGPGIVRMGNFRIQGKDLKSSPQRYSVRVG